MTHGDLRVVPAATLGQQVADKIREAILEMRFMPGDRLVERQLCEQTGVSRALVREALRQLEAEGLIQIIPHRGPIVAVLTAEEAKGIYEVRSVLEALAGAAFAERGTAEQRARLRASLKEVEKVLAAGEVGSLLRVKNQFYDVLLEGAHNPALRPTLQLIHGRINLLRSITMKAPGRAPRTIAELRRIVRAIERRDSAAAWEACKAHVESAAAIALAALSQTQNGTAELPG